MAVKKAIISKETCIGFREFSKTAKSNCGFSCYEKMYVNNFYSKIATPISKRDMLFNCFVHLYNIKVT